MNINASDLLKSKLLVAFVVGVAAFAIPRVLDALDAVNATGNIHFGRSVAVSFLAGALAAGFRYLLAISPINLTPTDKLHALGGSKAATLTIHNRRSTHG